MLKVLFINQIKVENVSLLIITELPAAKSSITLCVMTCEQKEDKLPVLMFSTEQVHL